MSVYKYIPMYSLLKIQDVLTSSFSSNIATKLISVYIKHQRKFSFVINKLYRKHFLKPFFLLQKSVHNKLLSLASLSILNATSHYIWIVTALFLTNLNDYWCWFKVFEDCFCRILYELSYNLSKYFVGLLIRACFLYIYSVKAGRLYSLAPAAPAAAQWLSMADYRGTWASPLNYWEKAYGSNSQVFCYNFALFYQFFKA